MKKREPIVRADTAEGQLAGEAIVDAIEAQIREADPPETKETLERLVAMGETRENAIRYIATAFAEEVFRIVNGQGDFDRERYILNLKALPALPGESETEV